MTTLSLFEKKLTAAYGPLLKQMTYTRLRADTIQVIDIEKAEKIKSGEDSVPRKQMDIKDMGSLGKICRSRAIIEFEKEVYWKQIECATATCWRKY